MNFLMRKMLKMQLKGIPPEYQDKLIDAIEKNPELFKKIGDEVQEEVKKGKDQQAAAMEVMSKYKDQLQGILK